MHRLTTHIGARLLPVLKRDRIPENNANLFENVHRSSIDPMDLFSIHWFTQRQAAPQARQHIHFRNGALRSARCATAGSPIAHDVAPLLLPLIDGPD